MAFVLEDDEIEDVETPSGRFVLEEDDESVEGPNFLKRTAIGGIADYITHALEGASRFLGSDATRELQRPQMLVDTGEEPKTIPEQFSEITEGAYDPQGALERILRSPFKEAGEFTSFGMIPFGAAVETLLPESRVAQRMAAKGDVPPLLKLLKEIKTGAGFGPGAQVAAELGFGPLGQLVGGIGGPLLGS